MVKSGETLYTSFNLSGGNSKLRQGFTQLNDNGSYTSLTINSNVADGTVKKNYTATSDMKIIVAFWTSNDTTYTIDIKNLMITKADNLPYEPYGATPSTEFPSMPVVCTGVQKIKQFGKNWFDKDNANIVNAYISSEGAFVANNANRCIYIKCKPNTTYKIQKIASKRFAVASYKTIATDGTDLNKFNIEHGSTSLSITTGKEDNYLYVLYYHTSQDTIEQTKILDSIQIEEGSKATNYEPYTEEVNTLNLGSTELCKIKDANGNVVAKDRAVYRNSKWQWEKNVGKKIFNRNTQWNLYANKLFYTTINNAKSNTKMYCNCFKTAENVGVILQENSNLCVIGSIKHAEFYPDLEQYPDVESFKELMNEKVIYYVLETPEYIDCTAEQSTVLDKLYNNFKLQKGTNNIIVESENGVGVNLELEYMQDLQTRLNLLEAMCVSNVSQEV